MSFLKSRSISKRLSCGDRDPSGLDGPALYGEMHGCYIQMGLRAMEARTVLAEPLKNILAFHRQDISKADTGADLPCNPQHAHFPQTFSCSVQRQELYFFIASLRKGGCFAVGREFPIFLTSPSTVAIAKTCTVKSHTSSYPVLERDIWNSSDLVV